MRFDFCGSVRASLHFGCDRIETRKTVVERRRRDVRLHKGRSPFARLTSTRFLSSNATCAPIIDMDD
jgi:hypothetical protein